MEALGEAPLADVPWVSPYNTEVLSRSRPYLLTVCLCAGSMRTVPIPESPSPPPPPPPRPADSTPSSTPSHSQNNQSTNSANDSKESNELSEAECDRDPLIKSRNSIGNPPNLSTEEMRRLLEK